MSFFHLLYDGKDPKRVQMYLENRKAKRLRLIVVIFVVVLAAIGIYYIGLTKFIAEKSAVIVFLSSLILTALIFFICLMYPSIRKEIWDAKFKSLSSFANGWLIFITVLALVRIGYRQNEINREMNAYPRHPDIFVTAQRNMYGKKGQSWDLHIYNAGPSIVYLDSYYLYKEQNINDQKPLDWQTFTKLPLMPVGGQPYIVPIPVAAQNLRLEVEFDAPDSTRFESLTKGEKKGDEWKVRTEKSHGNIYLFPVCEIAIYINYEENMQPFFQATSRGEEALISIDNLSIIRGVLPAKTMFYVRDWAKRHKKDLSDRWKIVMRDKSNKYVLGIHSRKDDRVDCSIDP